MLLLTFNLQVGLNLVKLAGLIPLWIKIILLKIENDWKNTINQFCVDLRLTASPK
jgi:hypothetical protein